jgi:hypothetical protein
MDDLLTLAGLLIGIVAALLLIMGLISAPWQVLLLLLVVGLGGIWWLMEQNRSRSLPQEAEGVSPSNYSEALDEPSPPQPMQGQPLTYRGTIYKPKSDSEPEVAGKEGEISGKYRGSVWKKEPAIDTPPEQIEIIGKYRGCTWKSSSSQK